MIFYSKERVTCLLEDHTSKSSSFVMMICVLLIMLIIVPLGLPADRTLAAVTVHPLATKAAEKAFKEGGNAVDAAVASALTLGVVDGFNSGIGGGCFMLIRKSDGEFIAIDGRETAPSKASRDMYLRDGIAKSELSQTGALAIGIAGALEAYNLAINKYGIPDYAKLLRQTAMIAEEGYLFDDSYLFRLK